MPNNHRHLGPVPCGLRMYLSAILPVPETSPGLSRRTDSSQSPLECAPPSLHKLRLWQRDLVPPCPSRHLPAPIPVGSHRHNWSEWPARWEAPSAFSPVSLGLRSGLRKGRILPGLGLTVQRATSRIHYPRAPLTAQRTANTSPLTHTHASMPRSHLTPERIQSDRSTTLASPTHHLPFRANTGQPQRSLAWGRALPTCHPP